MNHKDEMRRLINLVEGLMEKEVSSLYDKDRIAVNSDEERYKLTTALGRIRHMIVDVYREFQSPNADPANLKRSLQRLGSSLSTTLLPYNMKGGLWADNPETELRLNNDPSLNILISNPNYYFAAIDKKDLETVKKALVSAEESLLEMVNSMMKSMGRNEQYKSFFQGN